MFTRLRAGGEQEELMAGLAKLDRLGLVSCANLMPPVSSDRGLFITSQTSDSTRGCHVNYQI